MLEERAFVSFEWLSGEGGGGHERFPLHTTHINSHHKMCQSQRNINIYNKLMKPRQKLDIN